MGVGSPKLLPDLKGLRSSLRVSRFFLSRPSWLEALRLRVPLTSMLIGLLGLRVGGLGVEDRVKMFDLRWRLARCDLEMSLSS